MYLGIVLLKYRTLRQLFGNFSPHWLGQYPQATDSPTLPDSVYPRACTPHFRESPENLYFNKFPGDADVAGSAPHSETSPEKCLRHAHNPFGLWSKSKATALSSLLHWLPLVNIHHCP